MRTTDELVHELADREAIRDLPIRYSDCPFRNDPEGLVNLFTEDGSFIVRDPENEVATRGRDELKKMFKHMLSELWPRHLIHTHVVELLSTTRATGRCYVELRSAKIDLERVGSGYYEDEYVKVGEHWKFASRRLVEPRMVLPLRDFMAS